MLTGLSLELRIALSAALSASTDVVWTWTRQGGYWTFTERLEAIGPGTTPVWVHENAPRWMRPWYTLTDIQDTAIISSGDAEWYLIGVPDADVPPPKPAE